MIALQLDDQLGGFHVLEADRTFLSVEVYPFREELFDLGLGKALRKLGSALAE